MQTLINVIGELSGANDGTRTELEHTWTRAWDALNGLAAEAGFDRESLSALERMLGNLRGPESEREYTFMARIQEIVRGCAERTDATRGA
jgi:hypothetical protein